MDSRVSSIPTEVWCVVYQYDLKEYVGQYGYNQICAKLQKSAMGYLDKSTPVWAPERLGLCKVQKASGFCPYMKVMFAKGNIHRIYLCWPFQNRTGVVEKAKMCEGGNIENNGIGTLA